MGYQHAAALYDHGIIAVRHRDSYLRLAYPERTPTGVYKVYESMNLRLAKRYNYVDKAKMFIDEAVRRGAAYHLWFHPSDERLVFQEALVPILKYLAAERHAGRIWIATMSELASYCEARATTNLSVTGAPGAITIALHNSIDTARFGAPEITLTVPLAKRPKRVLVKQDGKSAALSEGAVKGGHRPGTIQLDVSCRAECVEIHY
jgi:hypothetical protein